MSLFAERYKDDICVGVHFRNVQGSTDDPRIEGKMWLQLWKDLCGKNAEHIPCCACGAGAEVGGHIVLGDGSGYGDAPIAAKDLKGLSRVFIVPLCSSCNGQIQTLAVQNQTPLVRLYYFMRDSKYDEGALAGKFEGNEKDFKNKVVRETEKYQERVQKLKRKGVPMDKRDLEILRNANPSLPSAMSHSSAPSWYSGRPMPTWYRGADGRMRHIGE